MTKIGITSNIILLLVFLSLQQGIWISENGLVDVIRLQRSISQQQQQNKILTLRNINVAEEINELKVGLEGVEGKARREFGLISEQETFFIFE